MKYLKYFLRKLKNLFKSLFTTYLSVTLILFFMFFPILIRIPLLLLYWENDGISLNPNDYCNLTDVDYTAILHDDPDGKANVEITEYLTFDVHAGSKLNTFKELWRELPEDIVDGLRVTYDVKSVTQILDDGTEIPYLETSKMYWEDEDYTQSATMRWHHSTGTGTYPDNDESLLIYIPWTYREKMTFKIEYSLNNAALKYKDCSELYLSMYSGNTITKLNSFKAQILIPNKLMPSTYYTYSFGTANDRIPFTESSSLNNGYHTFLINLNKTDLKFNYHNRYIEFCLLAYGNDKHIFTKYAPNNMYSNEDALEECISENEYYTYKTEKFRNYKTYLLITSLTATILIVYNTKNKYNRIKEKNNIYKPETDYEYFREIPSDLDPIFASELVFMNDPFNENLEKQEEYAAILLSLVRKKYVKISKEDDFKDWSNSNTLITLEPIQSYNETQNTLEQSQNNSEPKENITQLHHSSEVQDSSSAEPILVTKNAITGEVLEPLTTSERLYLELLERHSRHSSNSITLQKLQKDIDIDYVHTNAFIKDINKKPALESGVMQGYFQKTEYDVLKKDFERKSKSSLTLSLIILIVVNAISYFTPMALGYGAYTILGFALLWKSIYLKNKSGELVLFTQYGINEQAKWKGLYNFLNSNTLINEKEVHELPLWEKYLIYATAFGISEKVIKAIKIHAVELNLDDSAILNHHSYIHSTHFHSTSRSFGRSIHTSARGGGFGGHGYGGGGRRRWWRWRRPLISLI